MLLTGKENKGLCIASAVVLGCAHVAAIGFLLSKCEKSGAEKWMRKMKKTVGEIVDKIG